MTSRLRRDEWFVDNLPLTTGQQMVIDNHYAKGGSNTAVYMHGLFSREGEPVGVAWWLPPTRVAAESVSAEWKKVLSLTRMVILPGIPKNAASFLLSKSCKAISADGRFHTLVTYADEWAGHDGLVYRACGWEYLGRTGPYPKWIDPSGRQVAVKATKNRTKAQMLDLGYVCLGSFYKHKFLKRLRGSVP